MTPYRAIETDPESWHNCEECEWSGEFGAEDHCERTGHRVRAERWRYFERHSRVEAYGIEGDRENTPPGIEGRALFYALTDYEDGSDYFKILDSPTWEDLRKAATNMMILTEDTHHCFLEGFDLVGRAEAIEALAKAGIDDLIPVYRFSMGS